MRILGKYLEPCVNCGAVHWQGSKTTYGEDDYGEFCVRYRICKDCGQRVKTIQRDGSDETLVDTIKTRGKRMHLIDESTGKVTSIKAPTEEEAIAMIMQGLAKMRGE